MENEQGEATNEEEIVAWHKKDARARYVIFHTNDDLRQSALITCKTAFDMWTRLTTQYMQRAAGNKYQLQKDFFNLA